MPYNYTNGDGVAPLLVTEPNGATETVSILDNAIRQIKAYLNDPTAGPAALVALLSAGVPGKISMYGGNSAPTGYLMCNGAAYSRTTYAPLFAVIGTNFGVGDGVTTFNVPRFPGRTPVGAGTGNAVDATSWAVGQEKGTETHTLTEAQLPNVSLSVVRQMYDEGGAFDNNIANGGSTANKTVNITLPPFGNDEAHNNTQPSLAVNFIIKT